MLWRDADGTPRRSERAEPFRVLQLEIRNMGSIEAALEACHARLAALCLVHDQREDPRLDGPQ